MSHLKKSAHSLIVTAEIDYTSCVLDILLLLDVRRAEDQIMRLKFDAQVSLLD